MQSTCTSPCRLTRVTMPGSWPRSTYPFSTSCMRRSRDSDRPAPLMARPNGDGSSSGWVCTRGEFDDAQEVALAVFEPGRPHLAGLGDAVFSLETRKVV